MKETEILLSICRRKNAKQLLAPFAENFLTKFAVEATPRMIDVLLSLPYLPERPVELLVRYHKLRSHQLIAIKKFLTDRVMVLPEFYKQVLRSKNLAVLEAYRDSQLLWITLLENKHAPREMKEYIAERISDAFLNPDVKVMALFLCHKQKLICDAYLFEYLRTSWGKVPGAWFIWQVSHPAIDDKVARFLWRERRDEFRLDFQNTPNIVPEDLLVEMYRETRNESLLAQKTCPKELIVQEYVARRQKSEKAAKTFRDVMTKLHRKKLAGFDKIVKIVEAGIELSR